MKELLAVAAIDESRIAAEVTIYADKICVDEEMVRLKSHIEATRAELLAGGSVGRKLDFIAQEMNPGGQHHSEQVHGPGHRRQGYRLKDRDREGPGADTEY